MYRIQVAKAYLPVGGSPGSKKEGGSPYMYMYSGAGQGGAKCYMYVQAAAVGHVGTGGS